MFTYLPSDITAQCPLLVVLHGCNQNAESYDRGAGWSAWPTGSGSPCFFPTAAVEQSQWLLQLVSDGDIERGHEEAASIRQMVAKMVSDHGIDLAREFVTGLSAGGAMTSVMLATYPEVFAGGAIIAGLPYGAATNMQQAFETMYQCPPRAARAWGELVRKASGHERPVAARLGLAWGCRCNRHSAQRSGNHQAMVRRAWPASPAVLRGDGRWLSPPGVGQRSGG